MTWKSKVFFYFQKFEILWTWIRPGSGSGSTSLILIIQFEKNVDKIIKTFSLPRTKSLSRLKMRRVGEEEKPLVCAVLATENNNDELKKFVLQVQSKSVGGSVPRECCVVLVVNTYCRVPVRGRHATTPECWIIISTRCQFFWKFWLVMDNIV